MTFLRAISIIVVIISVIVVVNNVAMRCADIEV